MVLQAPQPWASGSEEAFCSQASLGGGKRAQLGNGHMSAERNAGLLPSPPRPPTSLSRVLSPPPGQLLPLECLEGPLAGLRLPAPASGP